MPGCLSIECRFFNAARGVFAPSRTLFFLSLARVRAHVHIVRYPFWYARVFTHTIQLSVEQSFSNWKHFVCSLLCFFYRATSYLFETQVDAFVTFGTHSYKRTQFSGGSGRTTIFAARGVTAVYVCMHAYRIHACLCACFLLLSYPRVSVIMCVH